MDDSATESEVSLESLDAAYERVLNQTQNGPRESEEDVLEHVVTQEHVINEVRFQPSDKVHVTAGPVINIFDEKDGVGGGFHNVSNYNLNLHFCTTTRNKMVVAACAVLCLIVVTFAVVLAVLLPSSISSYSTTPVTTQSGDLTITPTTATSTITTTTTSQCTGKIIKF